MNTTDRCLLTGALLRAINWEESLAETWPKGTPERLQCLQLVGKYQDLLKKINPHYRKPEYSGKTASIFELAKRGQ